MPTPTQDETTQHGESHAKHQGETNTIEAPTTATVTNQKRRDRHDRGAGERDCYKPGRDQHDPSAGERHRYKSEKERRTRSGRMRAKQLQIRKGETNTTQAPASGTVTNQKRKDQHDRSASERDCYKSERESPTRSKRRRPTPLQIRKGKDNTIEAPASDAVTNQKRKEQNKRSAGETVTNQKGRDQQDRGAGERH